MATKDGVYLKMKKRALALIFAMLMMFCAACGGSGSSSSGVASQPEETESQRFAAFTHEIFTREVAGDGISLHFYVSDPAAYGIEPDPELGLGDHTMDGILEYERQVRDDLSRLTAFDYSQLTPEQQLTCDIYKNQLETEIESEGMGLFVSYATLNDGILTSYPQLLADYRIEDAGDVDGYLSLLADLPRVFEETLNQEKARSEAGLFMSEIVLDQVLDAGGSILENPEKSFMLTSFEERLAALTDLDAGKREEYLRKNREIWMEQVVPAGQVLLDGLEALRGACSQPQGLWQYENGREYYAYLIKATSGVDSTMEEIIALLEDSMEQNINDMMLILYSNPQVFEEVSAFGVRPFPYETPDEIMELLKEKSSPEFPPLGEVNYQIKEVPESLQASTAPAYYLTPPIDKPQDNFIYINGYEDYKNQTEGERLVETLAHEGYPGHLFQRNYFNQQDPDPIRHIIGCLGYTEGWANYVDASCYRWMGYSDDASKVMQCDDILASIVTARIDIGIHYEEWDVDDVAGYLNEWGFNGEAAQPVFESILADPANSIPYVLGELEFGRLRADAEKRMGDGFDVVGFHKAILDCGPAPFSIVSQKIEETIASVFRAPEEDSSSAAAAA